MFVPGCSRTQSDVKSRKSATSGNGISIQVAQSTRSGKETGVKSKPNSTTAATIGGLSDEDDNAKRGSILQSPLKGTKQLSSGVSSHTSWIQIAFLILP